MRTRIAVNGFSEAEVRDGLDALLDEFRARPWIVGPTAEWDAAGGRLIVTAHYDGADAATLSKAAADEVWDCVIACLNFASDGIRFDVTESCVVPYIEQ